MAGLAVAWLACRPAPGSPEVASGEVASAASATAPARPAVLPFSIREFRAEAEAARRDAELPVGALAALPTLHRLRHVERACVPFVHAVYEEDSWAPDDVHVRRGHLLLLGRHRGKLLALATRCTVDFRHPGWAWVDPGERGEPELVAGAVALEAPDGRREAYLVAGETVDDHPFLLEPEGNFVDPFGAAVGCDADGFAAVRTRGGRVTIHPIGNNDLALVEFAGEGPCVTGGTFEPLGLADPMAAVQRLTAALDEVGGLLQTRLVAQCEACDERMRRAVPKPAPTLTTTLARLIPFAGALLALDAEAAWEGIGRAPGLGTVLDAIDEWGKVCGGVADVEAFCAKFPEGEPLVLVPAHVTIARGDTFTATDLAGATHRLRLAYCASREPLGRAVLAEMVAMAAREKRLLVAVPDGRDPDGTTHVHLFVATPGQFPPAGWREAAATLDGYVNLVCIRRGAAIATDPLSIPGPTRCVLEALRRVDGLDR